MSLISGGAPVHPIECLHMKNDRVPLPPHPELTQYYGSSTERRSYVRNIFDDTAPWYDLSTGILALGSGDRYRSKALIRSGLKPGMRLFDLATGTGAVAAAAREGVGDLEIVGADLSAGMLYEAKRKGVVLPVQALGEHLPFGDGVFDMISIGFALRHFSDLRATFAELRRVLRSGGRIVILEITPPEGRLGRKALEIYMKRIIPLLVRLRSRERRVQEMLEYYWDTTDTCVPPSAIEDALRHAGFVDVGRHIEAFINSEYTATAP